MPTVASTMTTTMTASTHSPVIADASAAKISTSSSGIPDLIHQHPRAREPLVLAHLVRSVLAQPSLRRPRPTGRRASSRAAAPTCRRQHSSSRSAGLRPTLAATGLAVMRRDEPQPRQHRQPEAQASEQERRGERRSERRTPIMFSVHTEVASKVPSPPGTMPTVRNTLAIMKLANTAPAGAVAPND